MVYPQRAFGSEAPLEVRAGSPAGIPILLNPLASDRLEGAMQLLDLYPFPLLRSSRTLVAYPRAPDHSTGSEFGFYLSSLAFISIQNGIQEVHHA